MTHRQNRSVGVVLLSAFFAFGALMAVLSAFALLVPGGWREQLWRLNPAAHEGFLNMGRLSIALMSVVAAVCAAAATGLWTRARWGLRLAIGLLGVNMIADATSAFIRHDFRTLIGVPIGIALLAYLSTKSVRSQFQPTAR